MYKSAKSGCSRHLPATPFIPEHWYSVLQNIGLWIFSLTSLSLFPLPCGFRQYASLGNKTICNTFENIYNFQNCYQRRGLLIINILFFKLIEAVSSFLLTCGSWCTSVIEVLEELSDKFKMTYELLKSMLCKWNNLCWVWTVNWFDLSCVGFLFLTLSSNCHSITCLVFEEFFHIHITEVALHPYNKGVKVWISIKQGW